MISRSVCATSRNTEKPDYPEGRFSRATVSGCGAGRSFRTCAASLVRHFLPFTQTGACAARSCNRACLFTRKTQSMDESRDVPRVASVVSAFRPDALINAIGIVKQRTETGEGAPSDEGNEFP